MKTKGTIVTGLGKGAYFISQDFYKKELIKNCGFEPYPGTLNIIIPDKYLEKINKIKNDCTNIIKSNGEFGAVNYVSAILNEYVKGAIVFPVKTEHEENYIEFIAPCNLKEKLNLKDGDIVDLEIIE